MSGPAATLPDSGGGNVYLDPPIVDIYPEGDLIINLTILDPFHKPWPAASSDIQAPDVRVKVSSAVISVASSGSGIGSALKTLLGSDQCNHRDSKRARGMNGPLSSSLSSSLAPCKEGFVPQGPGVRWYLKYRPTPRMVGVSPPTEVHLVLRLSHCETFAKGHRDAFHNILRILHFQQPQWEVKDGTSPSSFYLLGKVSELAWVFGCEKAIAPMIKLAKYLPPSDDSRISMISRIRMAFVWKDPQGFQKATSEFIFHLKGEGKETRLGTDLEAHDQRGFNDLDEMGVMAFLHVPLYKARARMIQGLFRVVADTYHSFVTPEDYPKRNTKSPLALQLLLGGLVKAMNWQFPGECKGVLGSVGVYPQDVDPNSREYENQSPAHIFSRLMIIKLELEAAWSAAKDCESKGVTEIVSMRGGGAGCSAKTARPMELGMSTCKILPSPITIFQAALNEAIKDGGLNLEDYPDLPRPCDLGHKA